VGKKRAEEEHTPSYEGTRTPSPTAPSFKLTKMVCAEADEAAAARRMEEENFMMTDSLLVLRTR